MPTSPAYPGSPPTVTPYAGALLRHPTQKPVRVTVLPTDPEAAGLHTPVFGHSDITALDHDLTRQHPGDPLGERITVSGRVVDGDGRPVRHQLIELWQANSAGRYAHRGDRHNAPLDPNFTGVGRTLTDDNGAYTFTTIKPGAYPLDESATTWRPAHLHFSIFGNAFTQRLVTQMYFPGDPLLPYDPILHAIPDAPTRHRLIATYDPALNRPDNSLGYRWNITLTGPSANTKPATAP
ncbi:protocatechuate 3,4-dioxygenase subunit beta [Streptomyces sp. MST-110588]|uniref:protocatechuate 3,4-dioxygenase subunit beta n=1 Tax=Streptomyces sp. MST-110588 TaxID=2833628 RepID=UPI001F5D05B2|nr:protocatechuate 3,4-dioxygenase subunit beta [Streptomyces sp. MST-110588]UNO42096.1 protocatechuate 3,4-dioxygenase subunit beta [Streptomyces sp. MST-110588]